LAVAVALDGGLQNVYLYDIDGNSVLPIFGGDLPASVDALIPAPNGPWLAIQTTGADGDTDVWVVDTSVSDPAALIPTPVGPDGGANPDRFFGWNRDGNRLLIGDAGNQTLYVSDVPPTTTTPLWTTGFFGDDPANRPQFSADGSVVAFFDGDPQGGGALQIVDIVGNPVCPDIPNIRAMAASPTSPLFAVLVDGGGATGITLIGTDCGTQDLGTIPATITGLFWAPNGDALALVGADDTGATVVWMFANNELRQVEPSVVGISGVLGWSPNSDVLALFADNNPPADVWVVGPASLTPTLLEGSATTEGANYVTAVWWPQR
jgi:hypothetical protein